MGVLSFAPHGRCHLRQEPDAGNPLVRIRGRAIWTSGVSGEKPLLLVRMDPGSMGTEPRISPDGKMVAIAVRGTANGPYGELEVADLTTGKIRLLDQDEGLALSPAWSPDSRAIYFSSSRGGTLNIWKIGALMRRLFQISPPARPRVWDYAGCASE